MIELTQLESDVLSGKAGDKARAELKKTQAAEAKQALLAQAEQASREQHFNDLAASELTRVEQQITDECGGLLLPIREGFTPAIEPLRARDYAMHLQYETEQRVIQDKRGELAAMIAAVDGKISVLEAEKMQLSDTRRQSGTDNPEIVGRVGLIVMDLEVLQGIRQKYVAKLEELPPANQHKDWGLEGWQNQVRDAKIKALFSVIEACERVIFNALQNLKSLQAVSYNFSRTIRAS